MAEVTKDYADQVLKALEAKGNDMQMVGQELDRMGADEQKQFFADAGSRLGLSLVPAQGESAKGAFQAGNPNAVFQPDKGIGPIETTFRTARNQALMGFGEQAVEAASRGIAKVNPFLSKQDYQETFANKSIGEASKPAIAELQAGQSASPGAELLGVGLGEAAGWGASEGAMRGAAMALRPVKAAAGAASELARTAFEGAAGKIAGSIPQLADKWVAKVGGKKAIQELGQFLNDSGVTSTIGTLRKVGQRLTDVKSAVGEQIGELWAKAGAKSKGLAMDSDTLAQATAKYIEEAQVAAKQAVPDSLSKDVADELGKYSKTLFKDGKLDIAGARSVIKTMEDASRKFIKSDTAKASFLDLVSDGMRSTLKDEVKVFLPKAESAALDKLNRQYVLAKIADRGIQKQLNASLISKFIKKGAATTAGGYVGSKAEKYLGLPHGQEIGETLGLVGGSTLTKTTASALLHVLPELGSYGKTLLRVAGEKGLDALVTRHAFMYMNNKKYRDAFDAVKETGQGTE